MRINPRKGEARTHFSNEALAAWAASPSAVASAAGAASGPGPARARLPGARGSRRPSSPRSFRTSAAPPRDSGSGSTSGSFWAHPPPHLRSQGSPPLLSLAIRRNSLPTRQGKAVSACVRHPTKPKTRRPQPNAVGAHPHLQLAQTRR
uniref:zinc finger protein 318-like n=1 Tax=Nyctereutes procyonoides TaxID=34880 RepID=UPI0024445190|nr:zinc finger protein 318-like [Nyctereutes procyonoides]